MAPVGAHCAFAQRNDAEGIETDFGAEQMVD